MLGALRARRSLSRVAARIATSSTFVTAHSLPAPRTCWRWPTSTIVQHKNFHASIQRLQEAAPRQEEIPEEVPELSRFQELAEHGLVSRTVVDTLTGKMGIHTMTDVQRLTINETLDGTDVIAQARTGTGKTLAFLMPIVQRILKDKRLEHRNYGQAPIDIRALIISPTRELAEQIAVEAKKVVSNTNIRVQTAVGGTQKREGLQRMRREGCHILVATPGRVKDILSDPYSGVQLNHIETFVLDEADRLLDIGFAPEIAEIQRFMPPREEKERQTLMFSATVPRQVVGLVRDTLRPNFKFIRTTDPNEQPTHERVPQYAAFVRGYENRLPAIVELAHKQIEAHKKDPENTMPFKAIVYFGTTSDVEMSFEVFRNMKGSLDGTSNSQFKHPLEPAQIIQIHSKLSQEARTRNAQNFRNARSAILFSSDVTARGMDFPDVSHVIQVGLPRNDDDYIHRLGRTGRAGKSGQGWLIVHERQMRAFRNGLGAELPIKIDDTLESAQVDMTRPGNVSETASAVLRATQEGVQRVPRMRKGDAFMSMFGIMKGERWRDDQEMVDALTDLARYGWGMEELPSVTPDFLRKIGLKNVQGLNIADRPYLSGGRSDSGGRSRSGTSRGDFDAKDPFGSMGSGGRGSQRNDPFADQPSRNRGSRFNDRDGGRGGSGGFGDRGGQRRRY